MCLTGWEHNIRKDKKNLSNRNFLKYEKNRRSFNWTDPCKKSESSPITKHNDLE